jgi:hypothetical protein
MHIGACTQGRRFGSTDLGQWGFEHFFATHRCNGSCAMLGLPMVARPEAGASEGRRSATATSAIEVIPTKHLKQRKAEREIDTRSVQATIKHSSWIDGTKTRGSRPNTVMHTHNGVRVVAAGEQWVHVGMTAYTAAGNAPPVPAFV